MKISQSILFISSSLIVGSTSVFASHHFESAQVIKNPSLNQLDSFVFQSSRPDATAVVMTFNHSPKSGDNGVYNTSALYNIHIAEDDKYLKGYTYSFKFDSKGNYTAYKLDEPNAAAGKKGNKIGEGSVDKTLTLADGTQIWAGVAKDPFFGNSPGLHIFRKQLAEGKYDPNVWRSSQGKNIFTGRKCAAIVVDIPNKQLGKKIAVFMTTDLEENNNWQQVQYSAIPLLSHSMMFENSVLKQEHDQSRPGKNLDMKDIVSARITRASLLAHSQKDPVAYGDKVANMLIPDVITYNVGTTAKFSATNINGRKMSDDAMSEMLTLLIGQPTSQVITDQKVYSQTFPYVIPASLN
ncbi:DUF4331 domain-containing protein [Buttiauxella sp. B2]|uniref:DUF4331 family protein n=1 Tax=Buttiauxella sp. B2 TaxID=2587812 RepID=UPI001122B989|nr:DUF4331 family protein [Buttiauxella sp. B2]TNV10189.1 DUF4331 domain-containing protein [Buttiauxella sp. B2]